jgi:hypothetical protein
MELLVDRTFPTTSAAVKLARNVKTAVNFGRPLSVADFRVNGTVQR